MGRRKFLATTGIALSISLVGCVESADSDGENGSNSDDANDEGENGSNSDDTGDDGENESDTDDTSDDGENGSNCDDTSDEGSRDDHDLRLYNHIDDEVSFTVHAVADGEIVVSDTFELDPPEAIFTDKVVATIPEGTGTVTVEATVVFGDQQEEETECFDLPTEDPISGFEVYLSGHGTFSIDTLGIDSPH